VPSVKQRLAVLRQLLDWFVNGQIVPATPAHTACRLHCVVKTSKRQYSPAEIRVLLDGIDALGPALPCVDRPDGLFLRGDRMSAECKPNIQSHNNCREICKGVALSRTRIDATRDRNTVV
jgi:hypothetical protein